MLEAETLLSFEVAQQVREQTGQIEATDITELPEGQPSRICSGQHKLILVELRLSRTRAPGRYLAQCSPDSVRLVTRLATCSIT